MGKLFVGVTSYFLIFSLVYCLSSFFDDKQESKLDFLEHPIESLIGYQENEMDLLSRIDSPSMYDMMRIKREKMWIQERQRRFRNQRNRIYFYDVDGYQEAGGMGTDATGCQQRCCPRCQVKLVPPEVAEILNDDRRYRE